MIDIVFFGMKRFSARNAWIRNMWWFSGFPVSVGAILTGKTADSYGY